jgi:hypothetical protein
MQPNLSRESEGVDQRFVEMSSVWVRLNARYDHADIKERLRRK